MKLVLILMIKNEERILKRCLEALIGVVDAFCICDTGSTDNSVAIAREFLKSHEGCITEEPWKNFGYNRSVSFKNAKKFVEEEEWNLNETYGLLLDADMVFVPGKLRDYPLDKVGYTLIQCNGNLEYPNTRLVRFDHDWVCRGVTHEYWDGPSSSISKEVCYIDDRNDGGCKADKFTRDAMLLEKGLEEEPDNVRYKFYLAQTYHSLGRWKDAIAMYKKRIEAGGWFEEVWYSHFMIAGTYLILGDPIKFEQWMLKAYKFHPKRAEGIYKLTKYFREKGEHYKAYHYMKLGRAIPYPSDSLFIEKDVYNGLFDYEETILDYYVTKKSEGLRHSINYLIHRSWNLDNVYRNLPFYIEPIADTVQTHPVLRDAAGLDYHPTSVAIFRHGGKDYHNVRFVNYVISQKDGSYLMKDKFYSDKHVVRTQNVLWTPEESVVMNDSSVDIPRKHTHILGLEDVRVYHDALGHLRFTATSSEYSDKIRIVTGIYNLQEHRYEHCRVMQSPTDAQCEKNWIPIESTNDVIYRWSPLEVGTFEGDMFMKQISHTTPWFFQHLRGSAVAFRHKKEIWCLTHFVEYGSPRKYFHCIVALDTRNYKPLRISMPFVFREVGVEYCIGFSIENDIMTFIFSSWDDNPCITKVPTYMLDWIQT